MDIDGSWELLLQVFHRNGFGDVADVKFKGVYGLCWKTE